mmetsp:Transcript_57650/g.106578  ORF Transcript_57650/g.106578 Transcript_57650/m.106578 type:complete len:199 (-) Transcript_57650:25-621(-)
MESAETLWDPPQAPGAADAGPRLTDWLLTVALCGGLFCICATLLRQYNELQRVAMQERPVRGPRPGQGFPAATVRQLALNAEPSLLPEDITAECCICLDILDVAAHAALGLPCCAWVYHADCLRGWLEVSASCPRCRLRVSADAVLRKIALQLPAETAAARATEEDSRLLPAGSQQSHDIVHMGRLVARAHADEESLS